MMMMMTRFQQRARANRCHPSEDRDSHFNRPAARISGSRPRREDDRGEPEWHENLADQRGDGYPARDAAQAPLAQQRPIPAAVAMHTEHFRRYVYGLGYT